MIATNPDLTSTPTSTKLEARDVDIYYGTFHAIKNANLNVPEHCVTALDRPVGLRQVDVSARAQPDARSHARRARRRRRVARRREHLRARRRPGHDPASHRHGLPAPQSVPEDDLRERRLRAQDPRRAQPAKLRGDLRDSRCAKPRSGTRSRTGSTARHSISRAGSSSACASRACWPSIPK